MRRRNGVDRARYEQVVDQRDEARSEAARHVGTIVERSTEIDSLREELAATRKVLAAETRRANHLQRRLDDCLGFNTSQVTDGRLWQQTRTDKKGAMS
jgi:hypothetical protein